MKKAVVLFAIFFLISCKSSDLPVNKSADLLDISKETDADALVNIENYSKDFVFDMKYASNDNFLKEKVYPCPECFLRVKTVRNLLAANNTFLEKKYRIKIFDCYRPLDIQKKMWKIVPDANYVANPKKGSMHNRGNAVDVTLIDSTGTELDMGTSFDFFGAEAHHSYQNLPENVLANRKLLKEIMEQHDFKALESEWWHYSLNGSGDDKVLNRKWHCD